MKGNPKKRKDTEHQTVPITCPKCWRKFKTAKTMARHVCIFPRTLAAAKRLVKAYREEYPAIADHWLGK